MNQYFSLRFTLLLMLLHQPSLVHSGTLVVTPDLQLKDINARVDFPLWRFYSYASNCLLGCFYYDWFGGTGWNERRFEDDYVSNNNGNDFVFETDDSKTCWETYCGSETDNAVMDVVLTANGLTYRSTVIVEFDGSSTDVSTTCQISSFVMECNNPVAVQWTESGTTNLKVVISEE